MSKFLKYGLWGGLLSALLNTGIVLLFLVAKGDEIVWAGQNKDTLYPAVVFAVSLVASLIGGLLAGSLFRKQANGFRNYFVLVVVMVVLNSIAGETMLSESYRLLSHVTHLVAAAVSIWTMGRAGLRGRK